MRIYDTRLYVVETTPGISGFKRHGETETRIMQGRTVKQRELRLGVVREFKLSRDPLNRATVRLEDGRLPEFQETASIGAWTGNFGWSGGPDAKYPSVLVLEAGP